MAALAEQATELARAPAGLPRLFLLEEEYLRMLTSAELAWVNSVVAELRAGRLTWSAKWLAEMAAKFNSAADEHHQEKGVSK